jgi:hypothetical protein
MSLALLGMARILKAYRRQAASPKLKAVRVLNLSRV